MKRVCNLHRSASLGMVVLLSACSSVPQGKIAVPLEKKSMKVKLQIESQGFLIVTNRSQPKNATCEKLNSMIRATVKNEDDGKTIAMTASCRVIKGQPVLISKKAIAPSRYSIEVTREEHNEFNGNPVILMKYEDPEFNATEDSVIDGAKELALGQTLKGKVNYAAGQLVNWVKVKAKGSVGLTALQGGAKEAQVDVLEKDSGGSLKVIGRLENKKKRVFKSDGELYVKVAAKSLSGESTYSLISSEGGSIKAMNVPVIDCYPLSETSSLVLLKKVEGLKVADRVRVFGKRATGDRVLLGSCEVTTVEGEQANCRLSEGLSGTFVEYRAETRIVGG